MTKSDQTDSLPAAQEADPSPQTEQPSKTEVGETQPGNSLAGAELAQAALNDPETAKQLRAHFQSGKDKGIAKVEKKADAALAQIEQFAKALGVDPAKIEEAQREIVLNDIVQERLNPQQTDSQPVASGVTAAETQQLASSLLTSVATPEVMAAVQGDLKDKLFANPEQAQQAIMTSYTNHVTKPQAGPADAGQQLGTSSPEANADGLIKEYTIEMNKVRGDAPALRAVKEMFRGKGVDVDNIGFTA